MYKKKIPDPIDHPEYGRLIPVCHNRTHTGYWLSEGRQLFVGEPPLLIVPASRAVVATVRSVVHERSIVRVPFNEFPLEGVEWDIVQEMAEEAVSSLLEATP